MSAEGLVATARLADGTPSTTRSGAEYDVLSPSQHAQPSHPTVGTIRLYQLMNYHRPPFHTWLRDRNRQFTRGDVRTRLHPHSAGLL